jgi:hypothetical protein
MKVARPRWRWWGPPTSGRSTSMFLKILCDLKSYEDMVVNPKLRSGLLNNSTKKYCGTDLSNMVEMDQDPKVYRTQQENLKKNVAQV